MELEAYGLGERETEQGGCLGLIALSSQLKQCQPVGFQLGGKAAFCAKLAGASSSKFQPSPAQPKSSSQFCALAMVKRGATEGAYRIHSRHSLSRKQKQGRREGVRLRQGKDQTVAMGRV